MAYIYVFNYMCVCACVCLFIQLCEIYVHTANFKGQHGQRTEGGPGVSVSRFS